MKLIKFYAEWCHPCKTYGPYLEQYAKEKGIELESFDIDSDEGFEMSKKFTVRGVPTTVFLDGDVQRTMAGTLTKNQLDDLVA